MATVYIKKFDKTDYQNYAKYKDSCADNVESGIKLLRKKVNEEGILRECQNRMYYISKTEKQKAKKKAGRRKQLKQMYKEKRLAELYDY